MRENIVFRASVVADRVYKAEGTIEKLSATEMTVSEGIRRILQSLTRGMKNFISLPPPPPISTWNGIEPSDVAEIYEAGN